MGKEAVDICKRFEPLILYRNQVNTIIIGIWV